MRVLVDVLMQIDRYGVDASKAVESISRQLLEHEIITEEYGGEVPIVPVSKTCRTPVLRDAYCCIAACIHAHLCTNYGSTICGS